MINFQVAETFISIQGESTWVGMPCFFIRLAGCNLRCSYCDTQYAFEGGRICGFSDLLAEASRAGAPAIEVTGGEPLIQDGVPELLRALLPLGTVLLETNGSMSIAPVPEGAHIILDVKSPASGESASFNFENFELLRPGDEIKFVLCDRADYEWACALVAQYKLLSLGRTVLFSAAWGRLAHKELAEWVLSDRIHVRINPVLHRWLWPGDNAGR